MELKTDCCYNISVSYKVYRTIDSLEE